MSDLVVIGFDEEYKAFEIRAELVKLQKDYLIEMEDLVVLTKDDKGKVKLHQSARCRGCCRLARPDVAYISALSTGGSIVALVGSASNRSRLEVRPTQASKHYNDSPMGSLARPRIAESS
jgi:hypothetical protein